MSSRPSHSTLRQPLGRIQRADAVICINMIHIAPWDAAIGLVRGAAAVLPVGGQLYLYGPFRRNGRHTAPSNETFDRSLRDRDPAWGVRDLEDVVRLALLHGFSQPIVEEMPANNLSRDLHSACAEPGRELIEGLLRLPRARA